MSNSQNKLASSRHLTAIVLISAALAGCSSKQDPSAALSKAKAYQQKGESKAALIELKNAVRDNPDNAAVRAALAESYRLTGDGPSAEKEIRKAVSLGYDKRTAAATLARALL